jgi:hypothetical protein
MSVEKTWYKTEIDVRYCVAEELIASLVSTGIHHLNPGYKYLPLSVQ